jgi:class 3 adenylate cyclase/tetratricopeptide (TPR) repeat protein
LVWGWFVTDTQTATVLFTDMVGSTELASRLEPATGDRVRQTHFGVLRRALAATGGSEVKGTGDGVMAVFSSMASALACAVAMQRGVDEENRRSGVPVGLRVGMSVGEVTPEDADFYGDPVIEAARLCALAEGGQILVTEAVRFVAGRRAAHLFIDLGERELKGLPTPIPVLELGWEPLAVEETVPGVVPLPARLAHRPAVGVIGRDQQLGLLADAAKRVAAGTGREVVLIGGEPGEGKTTLVAEAARTMRTNGMTVLLGRSDDDLGSPYKPFAEALRHYVVHADEDMLASHVRAHGGELALLVPALRERVSELPMTASSDAETERYLLYSAVAGLLDRASVDSPIVLVLDDLHWADKPSLQLLRYLVAHVASKRLLVLGTYRDAELSTSHPLTETLAALRREPAVTRIDLRGLDDNGVVRFMESAAGHELDDDVLNLAHALYRETDGNPFFVAEVLRHLSETGAIVRDSSGRWVNTRGDEAPALPESVREVIGARVSRIGGAATEVLSTASVIGRDFELDLLAEASGQDEDPLLDLLDQAKGAALVRELPGGPGRYTFAHALIQHTLYEDLGITRRARAHLQVGEALERLHGDQPARISELARHFLLASRPSETEKASVYARRAGDAALAALAPDDALHYYTQALDLLAQWTTADPATVIDLQIGLGTAQRQAGKPEFRATLLDAARNARQHHETERLVAAALANHRGFVAALGAIDTERVEILEAALEALSPADSPQRARVLSTLCSELTFGPLERRRALATGAKAMARRLGDPATLVAVTDDCAVALRIPALLAESLADEKDALALTELLGDPVSRLWCASNLKIEAARAGAFELSDQSLATVTAISEELQQPLLLWIASFNQASQALRYGDTSRAEELATKALEVAADSGQPDALEFYGVQLMEIRYQQGRMGELASPVAEVAEQNPGLPVYRSVLCMAELEAGNTNRAGELLEQAANDQYPLPMDTSWLAGMVCWARVAIELGAPEPSAQLLELLVPYHGQLQESGAVVHEPVAAIVAGLAGVVGDVSTAEGFFHEANELNEKGAMNHADAQTKLWWGRTLLARSGPGDREQARSLLERARRTAKDRGYTAIERRAVAALENC